MKAGVGPALAATDCDGKSAHDALAACGQRYWKYDWVIDFDVQKFFDEVAWDRVVTVVKTVPDGRWVLRYVERWLAAPLEHPAASLNSESKERRKRRRSGLRCPRPPDDAA